MKKGKKEQEKETAIEMKNDRANKNPVLGNLYAKQNNKRSIYRERVLQGDKNGDRCGCKG